MTVCLVPGDAVADADAARVSFPCFRSASEPRQGLLIVGFAMICGHHLWLDHLKQLPQLHCHVSWDFLFRKLSTKSKSHCEVTALVFVPVSGMLSETLK